MSITGRSAYFSACYVFETTTFPFPLDNEEDFELLLPSHKRVTFDAIPESLSAEGYHVPLASNFAAVDSLTKRAGIQATVSPEHPIKGPKTINSLAALYDNQVLPLVFVVPESIAATFEKQKVLTVDGKVPVNMPRILQYVAGLPVGVETSLVKKRRLD